MTAFSLFLIGCGVFMWGAAALINSFPNARLVVRVLYALAARRKGLVAVGEVIWRGARANRS